MHPLLIIKPAIVKLYPSIALGMLQKEVTTAGRIWLLLKYLDKNGRGWLDKRESVFRLTDKTSNLRVCGKRQLRNLLAKGRRGILALWIGSASG